MKPTPRHLLAIGFGMALGLCATDAAAQNQDPAGASPQMKRLGFLVGKWSAQGKANLPGQTPHESSDTHETEWILNGCYLRRRGQRQFAASPARHYLELLTYDPAAKRYRMWQFPEDGPPREFSGVFEDARLVLLVKEEGKLPEFVGIGAMLEPKPTEDGYPAIHRALLNTPAARAGLQPGDVILKVDGQSTAGGNLEDLVQRLRGAVGATVRLTLRRDGKEQEVTLIRQVYQPDILGARRTFEPRSTGGFTEIVQARSGGHHEKSSERVFAPSR